MSRTDYHHDPDAPPVNSLVPSTSAAIRDDSGRLLLIHKIDNDFWALPGVRWRSASPSPMAQCARWPRRPA